MVALILARNQKGIIGINKQIPWYISEDLKRFKEITLKYKNIVMGRKTFESLPKYLSGRNHIVLTAKEYFKSHISIANNIEDIAKFASHNYIVIGGAETATKLMSLIDIFYITEVYIDLPRGKKSDYTYFKFDFSTIAKRTIVEYHAQYRFETWERI